MGIIAKKLQNIGIKALKDFSAILTDIVGEDQGIYALYKGNKLYYIGRANNLQRRLSHHLRNRHKNKWDRFSLFIVRNEKYISDLESLLITICEPVGNHAHPHSGASDLKKEFSDRVDALHADEKNLLLGSKAKCKKKRYIPLWATYKSKMYRAVFNCQSNAVKYHNIEYSSPSAAARAITNNHVNGLIFWKSKDKKGNLVPLKKLL